MKDKWSACLCPAGLVALVLAVIGAWIGEVGPFAFGQSHGRFDESTHKTAGPVGVSWENRYFADSSGASIAVAGATAFSADGRFVYVTGADMDQRMRYHPVTVAYEAKSGSIAWTAGETMQRGGGQPTTMAFCSEGNRLYVAGWRNIDHVVTFFAMAYDGRNGSILWEAVYPPDGAFSRAGQLVVSPCGSRIFVIRRSGTRFGVAEELVALDAGTGASLWSTAQGKTARAVSPGFVAISRDGRTVYLASTEANGPNRRWAARAVDAQSGITRWAATGDLETGQEVRGMAVCPLEQLVYLAASAPEMRWSPPAGWMAVALGADSGKERWKRQGCPILDKDALVIAEIAAGVGVGQGSVFITATHYRENQSRTVVAMGYEGATGENLWTKELVASDDAPIEAKAMFVAPDGQSIGITAERSAGPVPFVTMACDPRTGAILWSAESGDGGVGRAGPRAGAFSADSAQVLITGRSRLAGERSTYFPIYVYEVDRGNVALLQRGNPGM